MNREKLLARDELGRQRAQEEFVHPIVLEAGAGTGKTATLVARVLAWSLGPGWEQVAAESESDDAEVIAQGVLRGIVAITFTEASAAEMSTRLGQALSHVAREDAQAVIGFKVELLDVSADASGNVSEPNDLHTTRARALLSNLDHLTVQTIHAFCRSLLATYPLEAKLHPDFVVDADGSRRRAVIRDILADAILTSYAREDPDALSHLATRGIGAAGLFEALDHLLAEGAEPDLFQADPFDAEGIDGLRRELIEVCQDLLAAGGASLRSTSARSKRTAEAITAIDATVELASVGGDSTPDPALLLESLRTLWGDGLAQRLRDWRAGRLNRSENDVFDGDPVQFAEAARRTRALIGSYERIDVVAFRYARRAIRDLLERATKELRAQGVATFAQLLSEAQRLLEETPAILKRERRQLDQLLVDEFQDTDPRQCSIVHKLALEGPEEERPGLFIVGDPKQSIYGWREADLEAYEAFVESVLESGGERHQLTTNFRSTPAVLAEVDRVMRPAMTAESGLQPNYEPLVPFEKDTPSKTETPETEAPGDPDSEQQTDIEHWIAWTGFDRNPKGRSEEIADLEARSVAADIERYRTRSGASWRDCAVLYRGRGQLEAFQNALRARGIPYDVGYYRRREVVEAAALVRTVLNPADHLALVTWLRCSAVGVPDAALLPLWQKKLPDLVGRLSGPDDPTLERLTQVAREAAEETPEDVPGIDRIEGWESNLIAGFEFLATARELARTLPADHFIEALRQRSLFEVGESARYQGEYRLANLERFFRQLESALGDPRLEIEGVLHTLRSNIQVQPDAEEAKPQGPEEDSVQLMTIHVAKGLEFRAVWVVQLHAAQRSFDRGIEAAKFDRRQGESERSPAYALFGWPTPDFHRSEERERRVEEAERVRTLYVAMTRARERLVLSGSWPTGDGPNHWRNARSQVQLLQMRQPGVPKLDELWNDLSSGNGDRFVDPEGVQWRFPALDRSTGDVRSRTDDRPAPSIERWRAEAAAYRVSSEAADERSRRSSHAPASSFHGELEDHNAGSVAADREAALLAGTVIHAAFERWRFGEPTADELVRARDFATNESDRAPYAIADRVRRRIELLFDRLDSSSSIDRLQSFRDTWHAREVPVISPPPDVSVPQPPLAAMTGSIDLLYLDEAEDRFVIVDYKTDLVEGEAAVEERAAAYRPQLEAYRSAIAGALPRERPPRCELWFVWDDRIVVFE